MKTSMYDAGVGEDGREGSQVVGVVVAYGVIVKEASGNCDGVEAAIDGSFCCKVL